MRVVVRDRYGSPDVLRLVDLPVPDVGDDDVLVRVHVASVNSADCDLLRGRPRVGRLGTGWPRPRSSRLGLDVAGTVEAVGRDVTAVRVGDEVWADLFEFRTGAFGEYVVAPARAWSPRPVGTTREEAAAVPHSGVLALQALRAGRPVRPGDRVLVNGAGGCVGPFAVQIAKAYGAEVTGVDRAGVLDVVRLAGADHVVDHAVEDVTRRGHPQRYDVVVDVVGNRSLLRWRRLLAPGGRYALIAHDVGGFFRAVVGGALLGLGDDRRLGVFMWRPNHRPDLDELGRLLDAGSVVPLLDRRFRLEDVAAALRYLEEGRAQGKVLVLP